MSKRSGRASHGFCIGDHVALSWAPSCGQCSEALRERRISCAAAWPAMGEGGLLDGTSRLTREGEARLATTR